MSRSATQHGDHAPTARAQGGKPYGVWSPGVSSRKLPPAILASPGLFKLPIKHDRQRTLKGKDIFPAISSLFALLEPEEATYILPEMRPLHPSPPRLQLPDFCLGRCKKLYYLSF